MSDSNTEGQTFEWGILYKDKGFRFEKWGYLAHPLTIHVVDSAGDFVIDGHKHKVLSIGKRPISVAEWTPLEQLLLTLNPVTS